MAKRKAYFFAGRNTAVLATTAKQARAKKRRGGDKIVAVRPLTASESKAAANGTWVRTRRDGKSPAKSKYGKGRGQGPARKRK